MGFNFPNTPSDGALFTPIAGGPTYTWSAATGAWRLASAGLSSGVYIGDNPPANPVQGQLWWNATTGLTFIYYNDGNSSQWVQFNEGPAVADPYPLNAANMQLHSKSAGNVAFNSKADGSGTDVFTVNNLGTLIFGGLADKGGDNLLHFDWATSLLTLFVDNTSVGQVFTNQNSPMTGGGGKFLNGLIVNWGQVVTNASGDAGITFAQPFTNATSYSVVGALNTGTGVVGTVYYGCTICNLAAASCSVQARGISGGAVSAAGSSAVKWIAIGS